MIDLIQNILGLIGSKFFAHFYYNSIDLSINTSELICDTLYSISNVPDYHLRFWIRRTWFIIIIYLFITKINNFVINKKKKLFLI